MTSHLVVVLVTSVFQVIVIAGFSIQFHIVQSRRHHFFCITAGAATVRQLLLKRFFCVCERSERKRVVGVVNGLHLSITQAALHRLIRFLVNHVWSVVVYASQLSTSIEGLLARLLRVEAFGKRHVL